MKKTTAIMMVLTLSLMLAACTPAANNAAESGETGTTGPVVADATTAALAQCLTDSGAKFYGAYWCPHCNDQKAMFADAVKDIPYVECEENAAECQAAGITGYPTWIFADGTVAQGAQPLERLASLSGCEY